MAADLLVHYAVTSRSRPKREASHCLAGEAASEAHAGAGVVLDHAGLLLVAFGAVDVVPLPL